MGSVGLTCPGTGTLTTARFRPSGPVALLVLLPGPAPARVVAPDLLVLVDHALLDHRRGLDLLLGRRVHARRAGGRRRRRGGHGEVVRRAHAAGVGDLA